MKDFLSAPGQVDLRDEICLAVRFLNLRGVSCRTLSKQYHISSKTWSKIRAGYSSNSYNKEFFFQMVMKELDQLYQDTHDSDVLRIIAETGRVHAQLPHDVHVWALIEEKNP